MKPSLTRSLLALGLAAAMAACSPTAAGDSSQATTSAEVAGDKAARLDALYATYWEEMLELNPLAATFQGDPRYNDRLPNFLSEEYRDRSREFTAGWLEKVEAIGADGLEGQDLLSYQIFVRNAKDELASEQFPSWMQPVNQFYNIASTVVQLGSGTGAQPFKTVADYDNWSKRASQVPVLFDQAIANMKLGVEAGVVQPKVLMDNVVDQLDALIKDKAEDTLFWKPIEDMPDSFSDADRERITAEYREMIENELMPAYRELRAYVADDYMSHARDTVGMAALPNGEAWYAFNARNSTTTDLSPAEIHQIGLDEVERIGCLQGWIPAFAGMTRDYCCAAIQRSILASRISSGTEPSFRTSAWKARMSNFGPSAASARSRSAWIFSSPILYASAWPGIAMYRSVSEIAGVSPVAEFSSM